MWILLLAVICSSFVVANSSVMPVQAAEDTDANTGEVVTSGTFGEYNGEIYTVDKVAKKGYHCISGQYKDTMAIYQDKIYWRKSSTVSGQSSEIIRMDLDGDNQTVLQRNLMQNSVSIIIICIIPPVMAVRTTMEERLILRQERM